MRHVPQGGAVSRRTALVWVEVDGVVHSQDGRFSIYRKYGQPGWHLWDGLRDMRVASLETKGACKREARRILEEEIPS